MKQKPLLESHTVSCQLLDDISTLNTKIYNFSYYVKTLDDKPLGLLAELLANCCSTAFSLLRYINEYLEQAVDGLREGGIKNKD